MRQKIWSNLPAFAPQAAVTDGLSIANVRGWRLREPSSGRRYTVLRLETRGGLVGYGEGGPASASEIGEAKAAAMGRRPNETEFIRHRLATTPAMEAAVNGAFLDLLGKWTKTPVYQVLGGPTCFKARVLAQLEGPTEDALAAPLERAVRQGFKAFTVPLPSRDSLWRMQAYLDAVLARVARMRSLAGADLDFVLDAAGTLTPGDAAILATALEKHRLMWFDEPTTVLTKDALARIAEESAMPIGLGRSVTDIAVFQNLLRWEASTCCVPAWGSTAYRRSSGWRRSRRLTTWRWRRITMAGPSRRRPVFTLRRACRTSSFSREGSRNAGVRTVGRPGGSAGPARILSCRGMDAGRSARAVAAK